MAGGTAAAAAIARAVKAMGAIVRVENKDFISIVQRTQKPLVVVADKGFWSPSYKYLTSYKGLIFHTKSRELLNMPGDIELVTCKRIFIPS
jgi:hypothetical protein